MNAIGVGRVCLAVIVVGLCSRTAVAQPGWMQPGVRAWYLGGIDGGGVISSNATEAYLLQSVSGTTGTVVRHAALTNWQVPQPAQTSAYALLDMGPHWIHPQRLQTLAPGQSWKGQPIHAVTPETHTADSFVPQLPYHLLVIRALFAQQPQRLVYKVTYRLTLLATGNAYFDAGTGLLLYHQALWGTTKMFFVLAEINYDFGSGTAYQEDDGPHTGFRSVTSEQSMGVYAGGVFVGGGSVVYRSLVESRYGDTIQTLVQSARTPAAWPDSGIATENYVFIGTGSIVRRIDWTQAPTVPIDQWAAFGHHLWWWLPRGVTGSAGGAPADVIDVFDVPMIRTADQPLTYTATQSPSRFHFSRLSFDGHGYLTVFSARDPVSGLHVQPGDFNFQNGTTVQGAAYFLAQMAQPAVAAPVITTVFPASGPTTGGTTLAITGANFVPGGTMVSIGGVPAIDVAVLGATSLTCITPAGTAGPHDVVVRTIGGSAVAAGAFEHLQGTAITVSAQPVTVSLPVMGGMATATFTGVTTGGVLTLGAVPNRPAPIAQVPFLPHSSYVVGAPGVAFTTATLCLPYSEADVSTAGLSVETLMVLQQVAGIPAWVDATTSHDPIGRRVCAALRDGALVAIAGPRASLPVRRYLAEGATSSFFATRIALVNPSPTQPANTVLRFQRGDATSRVRYVSVPPLGRRTIDVADVPEMMPAEFSTVIESDRLVVADRTMAWDAAGYGSHAETSVAAPALTWYLAEGATHSGFNLFYLVQNPHDSEAAQVRVRYLLPSGAPLEKVHTVAPHSRYNIWVDLEQIPEGSGFQPLAAIDVSAVIESINGVPVIVERAMYLDRPGQLFGAGHESAGVTTPATNWFLAEGATGWYFDLFVLIANPSAVAAPITATFLLPDGTTIVRHHTVAPTSRFNIWVDLEDPRLADTAVSTTIESTSGIPIIVERAMWWPGPTHVTWAEAHNSAGSPLTGQTWVMAEGEQGGARGVETYILVANTSPTAGSASVTLLFEDGTTAQAVVALAANSRTNVNVGADLPQAVGKRFGALVESLGPTPVQIVVERAMYWNAGGSSWAAGTNALATRLK